MSGWLVGFTACQHLFVQPRQLLCRGVWSLLLCRGVWSLNECPRYDIKPSDGKAPALENVEYPFTSITARSTLAGMVAPDMVLFMGQI